MNIIDVQDISKVYKSGVSRGGIVALDGASLSVEEGEIFGLLGPNGAGKTTLFKILLNIVSATSGTCMIGGLQPSDPLSRKKVGYLAENHRFPEHLTGGGLLLLTSRLYAIPDADIKDRLHGLLQLVGMDKWRDTKIKKYSKGMMQRIGLAQALIPDPDILLLDEPTDGVDPVGRVEIKEVLKKIRDEGKSVVLNSHLLSEVESVADRVAILMKGKVVRIGTIKELTDRKSHFEIEADFGHNLIEIPENVGRKLSISTKSMIVSLPDDEKLNDIIDLLRMKKISIRAIRPMKISLEQSFIETVSQEEAQR